MGLRALRKAIKDAERNVNELRNQVVDLMTTGPLFAHLSPTLAGEIAYWSTRFACSNARIFHRHGSQMDLEEVWRMEGGEG